MRGLENIKMGDALALVRCSSVDKIIVERVTKTQFTAGGERYTYRGYKVGTTGGGFYYHRDHVEPWTPQHDKRQLELMAEKKLISDRHKIIDHPWRACTQAQASAVLAAMTATGCFDSTGEKEAA